MLATKIIPIKPKIKEEAPKQEDSVDGSIASSALYEREKANGIDDEEEAVFNIEAELAKQVGLSVLRRDALKLIDFHHH